MFEIEREGRFEDGSCPLVTSPSPDASHSTNSSSSAAQAPATTSPTACSHAVPPCLQASCSTTSLSSSAELLPPKGRSKLQRRAEASPIWIGGGSSSCSSPVGLNGDELPAAMPRTFKDALLRTTAEDVPPAGPVRELPKSPEIAVKTSIPSWRRQWNALSSIRSSDDGWQVVKSKASWRRERLHIHSPRRLVPLDL